MKRLTVALLIVGLFTPTVFAQTAEKALPNCIETIRGTQKRCENIITPTAEQTGEKSLPGGKAGKAQAKRLTRERSKGTAKTSKAAAKAGPLYFLETVQRRQIRDFQDSPEGPIISVAR